MRNNPKTERGGKMEMTDAKDDIEFFKKELEELV